MDTETEYRKCQARALAPPEGIGAKEVTTLENRHVGGLDTAKIDVIKRNPDYFVGYHPEIPSR